MFLGILSEVAGKYAVYCTVFDGTLPVDKALSTIIFPMTDEGLRECKGAHLHWTNGNAKIWDDTATPILPETHGSIYVFGSQRLCDFAAGYFAGYNGDDVASVYKAIAETYDQKLACYAKLMPTFP